MDQDLYGMQRLKIHPSLAVCDEAVALIACWCHRFNAMRVAEAVGVVLVALVTACGDTGSTPAASPSNMAISEDSSYNAHVLVGSIYTADIDIKNTGKSDIPKLDIMSDSGDKFLDHNVIVKSDPCTCRAGRGAWPDGGFVDRGARARSQRG